MTDKENLKEENMYTYHDNDFDLELNEEPWYIEKWFDEDLIDAMHYENVDITQKNLNDFRKYCEHLFDDKSDRNEALRQMASTYFK